MIKFNVYYDWKNKIEITKNIYKTVNVIIKTNRIQYKTKKKKHIPNCQLI